MKWETPVRLTAVSDCMMMMISNRAEIYTVLTQSYLAGNSPDCSCGLPFLPKRQLFANIFLNICVSDTVRDLSSSLAPAISTVLVVGFCDIGEPVSLV
jgi:hypothetical protein